MKIVEKETEKKPELDAVLPEGARGCWRVAPEIEEDLEAALSDLEALRDADEMAGDVPAIADSELSELLTIGADLLEVFDAPTTTPRERKQLIRMFIQTVIIEECDRELARPRILWTDGAPDTVLDVPLLYYPHRIIREQAEQGATPREIAALLCREGLLTAKGNAWCRDTVARAIWKMRTAGPRSAA